MRKLRWEGLRGLPMGVRNKAGCPRPRGPRHSLPSLSSGPGNMAVRGDSGHSPSRAPPALQVGPSHPLQVHAGPPSTVMTNIRTSRRTSASGGSDTGAHRGLITCHHEAQEDDRPRDTGQFEMSRLLISVPPGAPAWSSVLMGGVQSKDRNSILKSGLVANMIPKLLICKVGIFWIKKSKSPKFSPKSLCHT